MVLFAFIFAVVSSTRVKAAEVWDARDIFSSSNIAPEIFIFPHEILKALEETSPVQSVAKDRLEHQFEDAKKFFSTPYVGVLLLRTLKGTWRSDQLSKEFEIDWIALRKKLQPTVPGTTPGTVPGTFSNKEKALLIYGLTLLDLDSLRRGETPEDRKAASDFERRMESKDSLDLSLLEVDPFYRVNSKLDSLSKIRTYLSDGNYKKDRMYTPYEKTAFSKSQREALWLDQIVKTSVLPQYDELTLSEIAFINVLDRKIRAGENPPAYAWQKADLDTLTSKAKKTQVEVTDSSDPKAENLRDIVKETRPYKLAQISKRGRFQNIFNYDDDDDKKTLKQSAQTVGSLGILFAILLKLTFTPTHDRVSVETWFPRPFEDLEDQMFKNRPKEWASWRDEIVRKTISMLGRTPKMKVTDDQDKVIKSLPQMFVDALWQLRNQTEKRAQFKAAFLRHGGNEMEWAQMDTVLESVLMKGRARADYLHQISEPVLNQAVEKEMKVKRAVEHSERAYANIEGFKEDEKEWRAFLKKALDEINTYSIDERIRDKFQNDRGIFALPEIKLRIYGWWQRRNEEQILNSFSGRPSVFRGWLMANRQIQKNADLKSGLLGSSINPTALSCGKAVRKLSLGLPTMGVGLAFGLGALQLFKKPDPQVELDKKEKGQKPNLDSESVSRLYHRENLKSEIEKSIDTSRFEAVMSDITTPDPETGVGSQIYALVKLKEAPQNQSLDLKRENAINGVLMRFILSKDGENGWIAHQFGMSEGSVPRKIFWKFDQLVPLNGDFLATKVLSFNSEKNGKNLDDSNEIKLSINIEGAKMLMHSKSSNE
ncbi:MAG: hypothetical protein JWQ35_468 [Bacteriovoracaceae bacterium]|nr:hypothetical protein [Bacteriovoracaceae bacterium]